MRTTHTEPTIERRGAARVSLAFLVELSTDNDQWIRAVGENLSESGMMVVTDSLINARPDDEFHTRIFLPCAEPICATVKIVRAEPRLQRDSDDGRGFGVQFCDLSIEAKKRLKKFVKQYD